jgi:hypothetical protein
MMHIHLAGHKKEILRPSGEPLDFDVEILNKNQSRQLFSQREGTTSDGVFRLH